MTLAADVLTIEFVKRNIGSKRKRNTAKNLQKINKTRRGAAMFPSFREYRSLFYTDEKIRKEKDNAEIFKKPEFGYVCRN